MFGLIVGTVCLLALFATLRRRHYFRFVDYYGYHWGHHHGRAPWHHAAGHGFAHGFGHGHQRGFDGPSRRRGNVLHYLFAELDTTPGQEKAIMFALEALRETQGAVRKDLVDARRELADLMAGEVLDSQSLDGLFARQQEHFAKASKLVRDFVALVHEALMPAQRKRLAELLADGSLAALFWSRRPDHHGHHHHHQGY